MSTSGRKQPSEEAAMIREFVLVNKLGMHARPAAMFVKIATRYEAEVTVEKDGEAVNGKSIMGLMMLAAGCGSKLKITSQGTDAEKVLEELEKLIATKFNED